MNFCIDTTLEKKKKNERNRAGISNLLTFLPRDGHFQLRLVICNVWKDQ